MLSSTTELVNKKRLFIAIACDPSPAIVELLKELQNRARDPSTGIKVVEVVNQHITLKFLGSVPKADIAPICEIMEKVIGHNRRFALSLKGLGTFRNSLWLPVANSAQLNELAAELNNALEVIGFPVESKHFVPHMTVARIGRNGIVNGSELRQKYLGSL